MILPRTEAVYSTHMITAIIQARFSSTRLPGKILLPLGDTTILGHTVRQAKKAKRIGRIVVATSDESSDDATEKHCQEVGVDVFRGSLGDVLDRFYHAALAHSATDICRITADCPVIDPTVIDRAAAEYEKGAYDYISTGRSGTMFPDGMDTEIFSFAALERAWREAKLKSEREHVTPYIWKHPEMFRVGEVKNERDLSHVRLTVDEPEDYEVLKKIVAEVRPLTMNAMVKYLAAHPEVAAINRSIIRDEGYAKSLQEDHDEKKR